jgi:hypothetical protein
MSYLEKYLLTEKAKKLEEIDIEGGFKAAGDAVKKAGKKAVGYVTPSKETQVGAGAAVATGLALSKPGRVVASLPGLALKKGTEMALKGLTSKGALGKAAAKFIPGAVGVATGPLLVLLTASEVSDFGNAAGNAELLKSVGVGTPEYMYHVGIESIPYKELTKKLNKWQYKKEKTAGTVWRTIESRDAFIKNVLLSEKFWTRVHDRENEISKKAGGGADGVWETVLNFWGNVFDGEFKAAIRGTENLDSTTKSIMADAARLARADKSYKPPTPKRIEAIKEVIKDESQEFAEGLDSTYGMLDRWDGLSAFSDDEEKFFDDERGYSAELALIYDKWIRETIKEFAAKKLQPATGTKITTVQGPVTRDATSTAVASAGLAGIQGQSTQPTDATEEEEEEELWPTEKTKDATEEEEGESLWENAGQSKGLSSERKGGVIRFYLNNRLRGSIEYSAGGGRWLAVTGGMDPTLSIREKVFRSASKAAHWVIKNSMPGMKMPKPNEKFIKNVTKQVKDIKKGPTARPPVPVIVNKPWIAIPEREKWQVEAGVPDPYGDIDTSRPSRWPKTMPDDAKLRIKENFYINQLWRPVRKKLGSHAVDFTELKKWNKKRMTVIKAPDSAGRTKKLHELINTRIRDMYQYYASAFPVDPTVNNNNAVATNNLVGITASTGTGTKNKAKVRVPKRPSKQRRILRKAMKQEKLSKEIGKSIKDIQDDLKGYFPENSKTFRSGQPDGKYGEETETAIMKLQKDDLKFVGDAIDGLYGGDTLQAYKRWSDTRKKIKLSAKKGAPVQNESIESIVRQEIDNVLREAGKA